MGLIHMNGRVYDPLLARFGTPDPMTESPFSTQGWNRYTYVGNSPVNFTDPSGYCFLGCFWKPIFKAIGNLLRKVPILGTILQVAAGVICAPAGLSAVCASAASAFVTGVTSGDLGLAIKAGITAFITAQAFDFVGTATTGHQVPKFLSPAHVANMAGHALVGCASAVINRAKCGPGALSAAVGSFAGPILKGLNYQRNLVAHAVVGGFASVVAGGKFANGAVTAAFGYLFNDLARCARPGVHCTGAEGVFAGGRMVGGGRIGRGTIDVGKAIGAWWDRLFSSSEGPRYPPKTVEEWQNYDPLEGTSTGTEDRSYEDRRFYEMTQGGSAPNPDPEPRTTFQKIMDAIGQAARVITGGGG